MSPWSLSPSKRTDRFRFLFKTHQTKKNFHTYASRPIRVNGVEILFRLTLYVQNFLPHSIERTLMDYGA